MIMTTIRTTGARRKHVEALLKLENQRRSAEIWAEYDRELQKIQDDLYAMKNKPVCLDSHKVSVEIIPEEPSRELKPLLKQMFFFIVLGVILLLWAGWQFYNVLFK